MLDSPAVFLSRAQEIGVERDEIERLDSLGLNTFGKMAFACNYVPGQTNEAPLLVLMSRICNEDPAPEHKVPPLRRLFFESYTLAAADMSSRLNKRDGDEPRKLAQAERSARHTAQVARSQD